MDSLDGSEEFLNAYGFANDFASGRCLSLAKTSSSAKTVRLREHSNWEKHPTKTSRFTLRSFHIASPNASRFYSGDHHGLRHRNDGAASKNQALGRPTKSFPVYFCDRLHRTRIPGLAAN